jgi:Flp pilus assembly protein TadD
MGLAAAYDQLGRFDFADRAYDQLLGLAGRRPQIVNNMGYSHYLRGDRKKAKKLLMEARAGMTDTTIVDANLELLKKG